MTQVNAQFNIGQIVQHQLFGYRGVIYDLDPEFSLTEDWYYVMARSRPPKDCPWYHVLVDNGSHTTYVAERNLAPSRDLSQISHPLLGNYFKSFGNGCYHARKMEN